MKIKKLIKTDFIQDGKKNREVADYLTEYTDLEIESSKTSMVLSEFVLEGRLTSGKGIPTIATDGNAQNKTINRILADENEPQITTVLQVAKGLGTHPMEPYNFNFPLEALGPKNREDSDSQESN